MINKHDIFAADQRLLILKSLIDAGLDANECILKDCLDLYGHRISTDQVKTHLFWLENQGLLTVKEVGILLVATITELGIDVAEGRLKVHGVKRPRVIGSL